MHASALTLVEGFTVLLYSNRECDSSCFHFSYVWTVCTSFIRALRTAQNVKMIVCESQPHVPLYRMFSFNMHAWTWIII